MNSSGVIHGDIDLSKTAKEAKGIDGCILPEGARESIREWILSWRTCGPSLRHKDEWDKR